MRAGYGACFIPNSFHADGVTVVAVSDVELRRRIGLEWTERAASRLAPLLGGARLRS